MPRKRTVDTIFIVMRMKKEYQKKDKKLYICFVDIKKAFDKVPRKVMEWAMRKKGLLEVMVRAVMSLYDGADKSEGGICIFKGIQSKSWCTSRVGAVATIACNSCRCYYRKCKKRMWLMNYCMHMTFFS